MAKGDNIGNFRVAQIQRYIKKKTFTFSYSYEHTSGSLQSLEFLTSAAPVSIPSK